MPGEVANRERTIACGDEVGPYHWRPTTIQLFRFSAITWNPHRIHYDQDYAKREGYPGVLVQSHLHGCFLAQSALAWAGPGATLLKFRWENRRPATPGDLLSVKGVVTAVEGDWASLELEEANQLGQLCAPGWAVVRLPHRAGAE